MRPQRLGPCLAAPAFTIVWHCAHLDLKSFAPFLASPSGTNTSGSAIGMVRAGEQNDAFGHGPKRTHNLSLSQNG